MKQQESKSLKAPAKWLLYRLLSRRRKRVSHPFRAVGIYKADRLGDFVLALGAIRRIVESEGAENCVLIIAPYARDLARREFPDVEQVLIEPWHPDLRRNLRYVRSRKQEPLFQRGVSRLVCLRHNRLFNESIVCGSIPAGESWGAANSELAREPRQFSSSMHFDHLYSDVAEEPGENKDFSRHRTVVSGFLGRHLSPSEILPVLQTPVWQPSGYVGVTPYGSAALRDFPRPLLAAAARAVKRQTNLPLRLLAPPGDQARFVELSEFLDRHGAPGTQVQVCANLEELIQSLACGNAVLSVETGTAHLAAALDLPMVALLGGGHYGWFAPWRRSERQRWLTHKVPCLNCNWICPHSEPFCTTQIPEEEFLKNLSEVLSYSVTT